MNRDAAWFVLVLLLGAGLLSFLVDPGSDSTQNGIESDKASCPEGTEERQNASAATGYDCVYPDPHALAHTHPAPILEVTNVVDDGTQISFSGTVAHLHPEELEVEAVLDGLSVGTTQPNAQGAWSLVFTTDSSGAFEVALTATHPDEGTTSETSTVTVDRTVEDHSGEENQTENETGNNTGGETGNTTEPTQPTYDPADLGEFWLDVFRCQAGQNITQVDDLSTTAVETHECSVSISMNETHITISTNGLPDHDFESTLACTQANDCTRAQTYEWTVPRSPLNDTTGGHDATNCPEANGDYECAAALGEVAIAINGVPFYGPEDGPGGDAVASHHGVYNEDRQAIELGVCHAHNGQGGTFHYHADANCLHWHPEEGETMFDYDISTPAAVAQNTANGSHSGVIGVSMDGYPIYGLWGYDDQMNVVEMRSSYKLKQGETGYNGIDDYEYVQGLGHLDVCNGHFGPTPEFPEGIYHYHSTMMNGEGDMGFPYFLLCYHGETFLEDGGEVDCSGLGETWGPGIGPPPPGCEGGPGGQLTEVSLVAGPAFSPLVVMWMLALALLFLKQRREI